MNKSKYELCKEKKINQVMKEFEQKKLKDRNKKIISNPKQAIAIGLSISESNCKKLFQKEDYLKIEKRLFKELYNENQKIKNNKNKSISLTSIKSSSKLYNYYYTNKNYYKAKKIKNDILIRIFLDFKNNLPFDNIKINEILNLLHI